MLLIEYFDFLIDKAVDITIGFSLGILILILHRAANKRVHEKIEKLHGYVTEEAASLIREIHKTVEIGRASCRERVSNCV